MAKIRVYELARQLNMTNKMLLDSINNKLNIAAKSHMSALDDDVVARIRAELGRSKAPDVEEKRVKPTIIRRRKRPAIEGTAPPEEAAAEEEGLPGAEAQAAGAALEPGERQVEPAPDREVVSQETQEPPLAAPEPPQAEAAPPVEAPLTEQAPQEVFAQEAQPVPAGGEVEPERVESREERIAPESPETQLEQAVPAAPVVEGQPPGLVEVTGETETEPQAPGAFQPMQETARVQASAPQEVRPEPSDLAEPRPLKPSKLKKKKKRDAPAKIISLPDLPLQEETPQAPEPALQQRQPPLVSESLREPGETVTREEEEEKGKKKKKAAAAKVPEEKAVDAKFLKKRIAFRKKEVIEGADLYDRKPQRLRKARKGMKVQPVVRTQKTAITVPKAIKRRIRIDETISLSDLAKRIGVKAGELIKRLMAMGTMATVNQLLDFDTAALLGSEYQYEVEKASFEEERLLQTESDVETSLRTRPPVVTIMGHVDHGKTSLLDTIRRTRVTEEEAGGITQHIGAYLVEVPKGQIAFIDTPGHEAFTAMRARGAKVTDIVVLVVAADDGVMPQTIEAINHSKAAQVPIIVAVNKIDKANADPERVMRQLADHGLIPEDWGGDTIFVNVSAKQKTGVESLLEMILLQAEVMELKANPDKLAQGHVIEAKVDPGRGPVATVLVAEGTLHTQDAVVCGIHYGKVRAMLNDRGEPVDVAGPSFPVEILGLSGTPMAGDELVAVANEKVAKQVSAHRAQKQRISELAQTSKLSLEKLYEQMQKAEVKELNLIIKTDVQGSVEALKESLQKLSGEEVKINVVHSATGTITESDISLASVSNAIVIGFNVRPNAKVQELAHEEEVDIRYYDVIYNVINDVKNAIVGMMASTYKEHVLGTAQIRDIFNIPKVGTIAGSHVTDGKIERGRNARLIRDGVVLYDGKIGSLRRFKDDVKEVPSGYECGIGIENYQDVKVGDIIECYYLEEIKPVLE